ncbi:imidazole glycerol phosphate synthase subunit HisH [Kangiella japonica]|uniref:Imidazole glycerol phosphate synthase subunit HisH n=1 Tax=Kangiella japonica TaxID=647384 RepID=A0ABP3CD35_9GAMM
MNWQPRNKTLGVINTKAGNLFSLFASLKRIGFKTVQINTSDDIKNNSVDALVIPGQGRFGQVMKQLTATGLDNSIIQWVRQDKPLLGICVGLQVLFEQSEEDPGVRGLGIFAGKVERLNSPKQPMVGWSKLNSRVGSMNEKVVYFVNSFGVKQSAVTAATVTYGEQFVAAIYQGNIWAFQFHPEKSGEVGEEIIKQCLCN